MNLNRRRFLQAASAVCALVGLPGAAIVLRPKQLTFTFEQEEIPMDLLWTAFRTLNRDPIWGYDRHELMLERISWDRCVEGTDGRCYYYFGQLEFKCCNQLEDYRSLRRHLSVNGIAIANIYPKSDFHDLISHFHIVERS